MTDITYTSEIFPAYVNIIFRPDLHTFLLIFRRKNSTLIIKKIFWINYAFEKMHDIKLELPVLARVIT